VGSEDYDKAQKKSYEVLVKYDVELDQWIKLTKLPFDRDDTGVAVFEGKIYISGGTTANSLECYDPSTNTWTTLPSMIHDRSGHHSLLVKNGSLIVVGGNVGAIEEYDFVNDTWFIREEQENLDEIPEGGFIMMKYYLQMAD